jgi:pSer/pThr/pTyr-binding forkhead associated (FHA) protein
MDESNFLDLLQVHGQMHETGAISVSTIDAEATIYLFEGEVVYAESDTDLGLAAVFVPMTWQQPRVTWIPGRTPPKVLFRHPYDSLIFQFAQLEDAGEATPEAIRSAFTSALDSPNNQVRMLDLNNYVISFEVLNSSFKGFVFYLEKGTSLVGRMDDCDIILPDGSVSGHHCRLIQDSNCIRVVDLGSTNGTRINGELVSEGLLQVGDTFQIGAVELTLNVKLKRKLNESLAPSTAPHPPKPSQKKALSTSKLDPKKLTRPTAKISGPITWKNLSSEDQDEKQSLFSKVFGKKN